LKILGVGRALPTQVITNRQLEAILDTNDEWIASRTGIRERRVLGTDTLTGLALAAAREAISDAGISGEDIGLILVATTMGDYLFPSIASLLQADLNAACPAMDLHAACAGFIYALDTADAYIKSGKAQNVLIVGAEAITRLADWEDRSTCVLFGDGAGAVVAGPGEGLLSTHLTAQTNPEVLYIKAPPGNCPFTEKPSEVSKGLRMKGQDVFRYAVTRSAGDLEIVVSAAGLNMDNIDWFLLHQANRRILDTVRSRLNLKAEKLPSNIHRTGNTSAASIPLLLFELYHAGLLQEGQLLAMSAFGAGLTSGACVLRWGKAPPQELTPADDLFTLTQTPITQTTKED
jgi:3-oxoacyl-[acyl-carrier-protein] synthase-3